MSIFVDLNALSSLFTDIKFLPIITYDDENITYDQIDVSYDGEKVIAFTDISNTNTNFSDIANNSTSFDELDTLSTNFTKITS